MIDVKTAVRSAIDYLQEFQDLIPTKDVRLEEVEYDEVSNDWLITLSIADESDDNLGGLAAALGTHKRNYKRFRLDGASGKVKSMKVRTLQPIE